MGYVLEACEAIAEARKLNLPVIAVVDTNCNPDGITYPIPGNDDAGRAISLYADLIAKAAIDGIERAQGAAGMDVGASEAPVVEDLGEEESGEAEAKPQAARPAAKPGKGKSDHRGKRPDGKGHKQGQADRESFRALKKPEGEPDDLKLIKGLTSDVEKSLNKLGIIKYEQIANLTDDEIARLDEALNLSRAIENQDWVSQAVELMAETTAGEVPAEEEDEGEAAGAEAAPKAKKAAKR